VLIGIIPVIFEIGVRLFLPHNPDFQERKLIHLHYDPSGFVRFIPAPGQAIVATENGEALPEKVKYQINEFGYRGENQDRKFKGDGH